MLLVVVAGQARRRGGEATDVGGVRLEQRRVAGAAGGWPVLVVVAGSDRTRRRGLVELGGLVPRTRTRTAAGGREGPPVQGAAVGAPAWVVRDEAKAGEGAAGGGRSQESRRRAHGVAGWSSRGLTPLLSRGRRHERWRGRWELRS